MKKILLALVCLPALSWASYQPITGSTVVVQAASNNTIAIPVSGTLSINAIPSGTNNIGTVSGSSVTVFSPNNNTTAIPVSGTFYQATQPVSVATPYQVYVASYGVNGSSVAAFEGGAWNLGVTTVTFNGTGQPVNATQTGNWNVGITTVSQSGTWTVQPGNTPNTTAWLVTGGTMVVTGSGGAGVPVTGTFYQSIQPVSQSGAWNVGVTTVSTSGQDFVADISSFNHTLISGTNPIPVQDTGTVSVIGTLADNGAAAATNRVATTPTIYQQTYLNGTAATQGRNGALSQGTDGLLWTANLPAMRPASYSASTGTLTSVASATDIAMLCGNASNTVLLYSMRVSCTQTTAGIIPISIMKRSTADTLNAASTMTAVAQDSNYAGAVSTVTYWQTSNPTSLGTLVGALDTDRLGCMATGTATPNDIYISPSDWKMKPIVLRGTGQCVAVNLGGSTVTGGTFDVTYSWIETSTITP